MLIALRTVFTAASLLSVVCRRTSFKPHRDVTTAQGIVRGYLTPTHAAYFGIPYARSPTLRDRFKAPEPPPIWDGIFEASHKIKCPQPGEEGEDADENCLVINVFAPRRDELLPVYVLIHDGDFRTGWGTYDPPPRLLKDGYIVVTFNYRLGALGFLCLGIPDALGNAGLKDQIAALYWIQKNIKEFGGNPDEVIVHGVGSAATSIQLLLLSGLVDGLVHKVIMESSSVLSPSSMTYEPLFTAYQGAKSIGYEGTDDADDLFSYYDQTEWRDLVTIPEIFLPCVEETHSHSLIDFDPLHRLKEGHYLKVPIMITYSNTNDIDNNTENYENPPENMMDYLPSNLEFDERMIKEKVGQIVKKFYFSGDIFGSTEIEQIYLDYNYDIFIEYPIMKLAMLYATNSPYMVYLMKFDLDYESSAADSTESAISWTIMENLYRDDDDPLLEKLMILWTNYLKMGDPTPLTTSLIPIIWQPVVTEKDDVKAITTVPTLIFANKMKMSQPTNNQQLVFWENIYGRFYRPHVSNQDISQDLDDND